MRAARRWIMLCALTGAGCLDGAGLDEAAADREPLNAGNWPLVVIEGGELVLDCAQTDAPGAHVLFECDSVTIYSCEEMSDAVLEYESGKRQRFADLRGQLVTLAARGVHDGQRIVSVRLPSDGSAPYAPTAGDRRFEAPADSCGAPAAVDRAFPAPAR